MKRKLTEREQHGMELLDGIATPDGCVYYDDATVAWWLTDWPDVARLCDYDDPAIGYSLWCAESSAEQLYEGDERHPDYVEE